MEPRSDRRRRKGHHLSYESSERRKEPPAMGRTSPTLRRAWPKDGPLAAICVQSVDVQCVLQFTLVHAAGCVLHRRTSRVIHRLKLCSVFLFMREASSRGPNPQEAWRASQQADMLSKRFFQTKTELRWNEKKARGRPPTHGGGQLFEPSPGGRATRDRELPPVVPRMDFLQLTLPNLPAATTYCQEAAVVTRHPSRPGTPQSKFGGRRADRTIELGPRGTSL